MSGTWEEDYAELKRAFEGPHIKNTDPNLVEDLAYKMRFEKGGVVWHSWIDPNRPESPPVEWPEYPKDDRPDDLPEDGIMTHKTDRMVEEAVRKSERNFKPIPFKPIIGLGEPCSSGKTNAPIENPDEEEDYLDSQQTPNYPGLYPGQGYPKWGGGGPGLPGYGDVDSDDGYGF